MFYIESFLRKRVADHLGGRVIRVTSDPDDFQRAGPLVKCGLACGQEIAGGLAPPATSKLEGQTHNLSIEF